MEFPNHYQQYEQHQHVLHDIGTSFMQGPDPNMIEVPNSNLVQPSNSFYLVKDLPPPTPVNGNTNLLAHFGLESTYNKFCVKKLKESLSSFLPDLPGVVDTPAGQNGSSLRALIEKPPIVGSKEIQPLSSGVLMAAFRLHPGPIPDQYRPHQQSEGRKRHRHHKNKSRPDTGGQDSWTPEPEENKRHKKRKHEDGEKKKKKKEKKRKKEKEKERGQ